MKVSKIILGLFVAQVLCLSLPQTIFCQTETLDMVRYTPPKGWTKTTKKDAVIYVAADKTNNTFCVLTIHSGTASSGNVEKDFAAEWKNFVVTPHQAEANPKTETETKDGWTMISANAPIEIDGIKSLAALFVFSGFGKTTSILAILNSNTYLKPLATFMDTIKLDQTPIAAQTQAPANSPVANSPGAPTLVGKWGTGTAADMVSGNFVTYASNATQKFYQFKADGTYSFVYSGYSGLVGSAGSFHITTQESGVYSVNGDSITITPRKSQTNSNSGGLKNNPLETVTYRWTIHYFEGIGEYALILHPDQQTNRDGGFDYVLAFPNSYSYSQMK
ncbi:MAG TPA: lipocalin family protein [Pyrinomonadaceae bacterium]|nr:lipocalin family protein [Pyrinomonadaceae bacterium]